MINSTQITIFNPISYIHYGLYFIYLRCILFLNILDTIVFSNMLIDNADDADDADDDDDDDDDDISINNNHSFIQTHSRRRHSFNSLGRDIEIPHKFNIFDINKTTILNEHTQNQINYINNLLFSDY